MKIKLNRDALYYKCAIVGIIPVVLLLLLGYKDIVSAYIVYLIIGIPILLIMKTVFAQWILGEKHFLIIDGDKAIVHHSYRVDDADEAYFDLKDIEIHYSKIPCMEAVVLKGTHPVILYKYMFSGDDYKKILELVSKQNATG